MSRIALGLCLAVPAFANGCANFIETQAITRFAEALEEKDVAELKSRTTEAFEKKALRRDDAIQDFEILNLPKGDVTIAKVDDISADEKLVVAEVGEKKRRLQYKLVRDEKTRKWLIDDITVKQGKSNMTAAKSVTDQMDLLQSVREFVGACKDQDRNGILASMTPELRTLVEGLPPACLAKLTSRVVDEKEGKRKSPPNAQMDETTAMVSLPRDGADLAMTFKLVDGSWKISDVGVESRKDGKDLPSLEKTATVMKVAFTFLDAYAASDREALSRVCTPKLFKKSLERANLAEIPLPNSAVAADKNEIMLDGVGADFVINGEKDVVRLALDRRDVENPDHATEFVVKEVTVYPLDSQQNKRLSAAFNAHSLIQLYSEALARRELPLLRRVSTVNFNERVWQHLTPESVLDMPLAEFDGAPPKIVETLFQGALTEVTVEQGIYTMTYVLRERSGDVKVDDVICAVPNRPASLKDMLETALPVARFMQAIRVSDLPAIQRTSSGEFNRLVWNQIDSLPPLCNVVIGHLQQPLTSIEKGDQGALIVFGNDRAGARVALTKEHEHYVIDEIQVIAGRQPHERPNLRETIRTQIAEGRIRSRQDAIAGMPRPVGPPTRLKPQSAAILGTAIQPTSALIQPSDDAFTPPTEAPTSPTANAAGTPDGVSPAIYEVEQSPSPAQSPSGAR